MSRGSTPARSPPSPSRSMPTHELTGRPGAWAASFARRTGLRGSDELNAILAGNPPGVLSMTGGFPNPRTSPAGALDEIVTRLLRDEPAVALQYAPCEGLPSFREYLVERQERLQGRRPATDELIVTSG